MHDLCSSKSKNTALNSKGEEEEEKVKNAKEQAKKPQQQGRQVLCLLGFFSDSFLSSASLFAAPLFLKDRLQFQVLL